MKYLILVSIVYSLLINQQRHPIHKTWKLVAEEITFYNHDYTKYDGSRDRLDSIKNETITFNPDSTFSSSDGLGIYTLSKDSIHIHLNGQRKSFRCVWNNSKLIIQHDIKENRFVVRSKLYLE